MKVLLDIPDKSAFPLLEVIKGYPNVKTQLLTDAKAELLEEVREAVLEMKPEKSQWFLHSLDTTLLKS